MRYHRLGHLEPNIKIKVGDKVKKGQLVGYNGTGNGQWPAHCHYDIMTYIPDEWTNYVIGLSKEWVLDHYADPRALAKTVMPSFDHYGYEWLESAQYAGGHAFHPGIDLNGKGSGDMDKGDPLYAPCDGEVVYAYTGTGKNSGWGPLVVIKEVIIEDETMNKDFIKAIEALTGKNYGDNLNEKEQEEAAKELKRVQESIKTLKEENKKLDSIAQSNSEAAYAYQKETEKLKEESERASKFDSAAIDSYRRDVAKLSHENDNLKRRITEIESRPVSEEATAGTLLKQLVKIVFGWGKM